MCGWLFASSLLPAAACAVLLQTLACGLPFLLSLWIARTLLVANAFRLDRAQFVDAWGVGTPGQRAHNPFLYEARAPWLRRISKALTMSPLLTGAFWAFMSWYLLRDYYDSVKFPNAVAAALACLCFIVSLGSYGFLHWQASHFRMTKTTALCFALCIAVVVLLQLGFTVFILDTEKSAFVVFMTFNLAPVMLMVYLDGVIAPPITFQQLLRLQGHDSKWDQECAELRTTLGRVSFVLFLMSIGALACFGFVMQYQFSSYFGWQIAVAVLFCDFACWIHNTSGLAGDPLLLHFLSLLTRVILFIGWERHWFAAVSIDFLIFVAFFIYHIIDTRFPVFSKEDALDSVVGSIESAMDEAKQREQDARVAALRMQEEAERVAQAAEEAEDLKAAGISEGFSLKGLGAGISSKLGGAAHSIDIPGAKLLGSLTDQAEASARSLIKSPEFGFFVLTALYVAYVCVALYADLRSPSWGPDLFPQLSVTESGALHPQWQIGLLTFLVIAAATMFFLCFRCYEINGFHWNGRVGFAGLAFLVVASGGCVAVSIVNHSDFIYVFGIYLPLIILVSTLTYCNWRRQDYRWNGWTNYQEGLWRKQIKEKREREKAEREAEEERRNRRASQIANGEDDEGDEQAAFQTSRSGQNEVSAAIAAGFSKLAAMKLNLSISNEYDCVHEWDIQPSRHPKFYVLILTDFFRLKHTAPDYVIFVCVGLVAGLCVALGLHLAQFVQHSTAYFVASALGMLIFTIFVLLKWFNTFTVGIFQVLVLAGLLTHCSISLDVALGQAPISAMAFALLYPSLMCLIMAMYSWKMNNWKLSRVIVSVLGVGCFLCLSFLVLFLILSTRKAEGAIATCAFFVGILFLGLVMTWSSNDFHLPPIYFKLAVAGGAFIIVSALVIILILNQTWFQMVTVLWIISMIALLAYTIQETRQNDTRKLLPSQFIFPVYEYSPKLNEITIRVRNNGILALILVAAECMCWGFIAALLIKPAYIGWIFFCGGGLLFLLIALEALFKPLIAFWRNYLIVIDSPSVIDQAREVALKSQLGADGAAFDAQADQDMEVDVNQSDDPAAFSDAAGGDGEDESFKVLRRLQLYWNFEEASEVEHLQLARKRFKLEPQVPDDLDVSQRLKFIADEMAAFDSRIAQVFEEQTRILVMFQLLINIGAQALQKKNRARVKDFLRKYLARKIEVDEARKAGREPPKRRRTTVANAPAGGFVDVNVGAGAALEEDDDINDDYPLIDLQSSNAVEIKEWARNNTELNRKAMEYIREQQENISSGKKKQEEQRIAAAERKKLATADPSAAISGRASIVGAPVTRIGEDEEEKSGGSGGALSPTAAHLSSDDPKHVVTDAFSYRQRGISFAVDSLDIRGSTHTEVVTKARAALAQIIKQHEAVSRANGADAGKQRPDESLLFTDPYFPQVTNLDSLIDAGTDPADAEAKSIAAVAAAGKKTKASWKRPRDICANPQVFVGDDLDPARIIQGDLEDCYLLSALSVIAKNPERIRGLFLVSEYNEYGIYGMCFFVDGEWRAIFVDDQFPYLGGQLAFARSKNKNEFWLPILEKCYAKLYRGYPSIIGGLVHVSFKDLTGGITDEVALDSADSGAFDGRLWARISSFYKEGYLMGCGNPKPHAGNFQKVSGIVQGHAYAILDLKEVGDIKLIQLRNPWGEGEWEGDWSDSSDKWTQKMRQLFSYPERAETDGIFWMAFEDFCTNFQRIYICRVFDNIVELSQSGAVLSAEQSANMAASKAQVAKAQAAASEKWCKVSIEGAWAGPTAVGHVCWLKKFPQRKPEMNPQFALRLLESRPSIVFLTLTQPTQTGGGSYFFISLLVLSKNGLRAHDIKKSELIAGNTKCRNSREICAEVKIEAGQTYTIFVSTYNPGEECKFTLAAYCRYPVSLMQLDEKVPVS